MCIVVTSFLSWRVLSTWNGRNSILRVLIQFTFISWCGWLIEWQVNFTNQGICAQLLISMQDPIIQKSANMYSIAENLITIIHNLYKRGLCKEVSIKITLHKFMSSNCYMNAYCIENTFMACTTMHRDYVSTYMKKT